MSSNNESTLVKTMATERNSAGLDTSAAQQGERVRYGSSFGNKGGLLKGARLNDIAASIFDDALNESAIYTTESVTTGPRFTMRANDGVYSVLADEKDEPVMDDPYNRVVFATIGRDNSATEGELFNLPEDPFVAPECKQEARKLSDYALKVRSAKLELAEASSAQRGFLHNVNQYVINCAWKELSGLANANVPGQKEVLITTRKKNDKRNDLTYRRLLLRTVEQWFKKDYIAYGHALVHGLSLIVHKSVLANRDLWIDLINKKKSFRPSINDLKANGIVPDVNVTQYKSLFSPIEWGEIQSSGILHIEETLKSQSGKLDSYQKIVDFVQYCNTVRDQVKADRTSLAVKEIKRNRLRACSVLKRESRSKGPLNMWAAVGRNYDKPEIRSAFLPGQILSSLGGLPETSPGALSSWIVWNRNDQSFELRVDLEPEKLPPAAIERVSEYLRLLS
ncbi:hypothetical protein [Phytophthora cinnamomi ormycovirus 2-25]|uniref:Uncharacterized protein n=1 Tax=Phytophthora cinnamomi ormycovirus 2-25 TaxID=3239321 RepID=A0AB39JAU5_9VIRU